MTLENDRVLVSRWLTGDQAAANEICSIVTPWVKNATFKILHDCRSGIRDSIDDVVQEALTGLFRNIDKWRGEARLTTFAYRVAINHALQHKKKYRRHENKFIPLEDWMDGADKDREDRDFDLSMIIEALQYIAPRQREAVILCAIQRKTYEEAARILKVDEEVIKGRLHRGRESIKKLIRYEGQCDRFTPVPEPPDELSVP